MSCQTWKNKDFTLNLHLKWTHYYELCQIKNYRKLLIYLAQRFLKEEKD